MNEEQILKLVENYLDHAERGLDKENPKLDFKTRWYNLKDTLEVNEFLKDTTAIANTPGLDGFIVIGFDEKNKSYTNSNFLQSNLKDFYEIIGLVNRNVDRIFSISNYDIVIKENTLSVLHIPPSFDKPHVIRNYTSKANKTESNRVFIKNGSTTRIANKYDLDFISYDRKNNIPEYSLHISGSKSGFYPTKGPTGNMELNMSLTFENNGLRPIAINHIIIDFYRGNSSDRFISTTNKDATGNNLIKVSNIIIPPMQILNCSSLCFSSIEELTESKFKGIESFLPQVETITALVKINTGRELNMKIELTD